MEYPILEFDDSSHALIDPRDPVKFMCRDSACQLVCAGDDVSGETWDPRFTRDKTSVREKLTMISAEVCSVL